VTPLSAQPTPGDGAASADARAPLVDEQPSYDPPRDDCVLCGARDLHPFDRDFRGHRIVRCGACGVLFMNPQYTDRWLTHYYSHYVPASGHSHGNSWRAQPEVRRAGKQRALQDIAAHAPGGRALMVGCGDGLELQIGQEMGWDVTGHDVDPETTARVAEQRGVTVHCGHFPDLDEPDASFDVVYLDQVIEHPKEPGPFLDKAVRLLRPGGVLYLGQPNIGSLSNRIKRWTGRLRRRRRGRHYSSQHHITYYSPGVLTRHLRRAYGLEVLAVLGSPKPSRRPWFDWLTRRVPLLDSSFAVLARKPS